MYYDGLDIICPICGKSIKHPYTGQVTSEQLDEDFNSCLWIEVCDEADGCLGYTPMCKHQKITKLQDINTIYNERDRLVALISTFYDSYLSWDKDGEEGFKNVVYIETGVGQLSWHIKDDELSLFSHLSRADNKWDGHTVEDKYKRIEELVKLRTNIRK